MTDDVRRVPAADWDDRLQAEIDAAADDGERYLAVHGIGEFDPTTTVYLPDEFTLKIDDAVRLVPPAEHDLDEIRVGNRTYRTLVTNADHEAGNENVAIEGGYISFENVDWDGLSHAPVWFHNCVDPLQEDVTVEDVAYDHASEDGTRQFGVFVSESEAGVQKNCVARRVGYDGIANRGYTPNRTGKMIGCEAYDIPGTGIQFAGNVRGGDRPNDQHLDSFVVRDCETDAYITIHSGGNGVTDGLIENNEARAISIIADGSFDNVTIRDNVTDSQLVAIRDEIRNLAIRGQQSRSGEGSSIRLIGYGVEGSLDRLTVEGCFSRDRTFLEYDRAEGIAVDHVRLVDNVFDPDPDDATFVDGGRAEGEGDAGEDLHRLDLASNTVRDATVVTEGVDTVRLRDNTLIDVDAVTEGDVPRLLRNGRGTNDGDPAETGEWRGHADFAEESNAVVRDPATDDWYRAVDGEWVPAPR